MTALELTFLVDDLADRRRLVDLMAWEGGDADAWRCAGCGEWGVFGRTETVIPPAAPGDSFRRRRA